MSGKRQWLRIKLRAFTSRTEVKFSCTWGALTRIKRSRPLSLLRVPPNSLACRHIKGKWLPYLEKLFCLKANLESSLIRLPRLAFCDELRQPNAIGYAKFSSRSHDAVIFAFDDRTKLERVIKILFECSLRWCKKGLAPAMLKRIKVDYMKAKIVLVLSLSVAVLFVLCCKVNTCYAQTEPAGNGGSSDWDDSTGKPPKSPNIHFTPSASSSGHSGGSGGSGHSGGSGGHSGGGSGSSTAHPKPTP